MSSKPAPLVSTPGLSAADARAERVAQLEARRTARRPRNDNSVARLLGWCVECGADAEPRSDTCAACATARRFA